ncbi:DNA polymerase III subunit beta [Pontiella sulfatireligans]|uniref:Beta sliding clamp n=1 Tax=Pontiella sulfatireligans TaxID=2750658 RepID=A0A6C2UTE5_9BACT|nr:DNA polymerase III subunit beta [Pontiella sulfatireligans]VGO22166.1 DNA polymerase III subunit beta [Pontiella sulfatireligans]
MKFSIEKDQILEALQKVQSIVGQRTTLPILSNVLLEAGNGKLTLTTTDMEVSVRTSIEADIDEEGSTTLPARRFFSICRDLPSHQVDIGVSNEDVATIISGSYNCKLEGLSKNDFPPMPTFEESYSYTLKRDAFKDILQKTSYAASTDESRAILNGSLMAFRDNKLTTVCTDGRRLALVEQEIDMPEEAEVDIVVPTKTVSELIKTLEGEGEATIKTSATQVAFEFGNIFIISKLIDGTYPNYRQVIPSQCEERIAIDREMLASAVRRVSLMLDDQAASVKVKITENRLELITSSPEIGESNESVPVKYSGKDITIAFNPGFLLAPLKHLDSDEVFLELSDELSPGVIKTNVPFLYVIMPIRVN